MNETIWNHESRLWKFPAHVASALCRSPDLTPAEIYFVLRSLGIDQTFRASWETPTFYLRAGMAERAAGVVDPAQEKAGWIAKSPATFAWAAGDETEAIRLYRQRADDGAAPQARAPAPRPEPPRTT